MPKRKTHVPLAIFEFVQQIALLFCLWLCSELADTFCVCMSAGS